MSHGKAKAQESLNWAMIAGPDDGDPEFKKRRDGMIAAAESKNTDELLKWADLMFTGGHRDEYENLKASEEEEPGGPIRWAREFLKLPVESEGQ